MRRRRQELIEAEIARMAEELLSFVCPVVWVTGEFARGRVGLGTSMV